MKAKSSDGIAGSCGIASPGAHRRAATRCATAASCGWLTTAGARRRNSNSARASKAAQLCSAMLAHAALDEVGHLGAVGAHRAFDDAGVGHHVAGLAGVDHGHRQHRGVDRPLVAADDGLPGLHDLAGQRHRVDRWCGKPRHGRRGRGSPA
jgi:hypothetical protein